MTNKIKVSSNSLRSVISTSNRYRSIDNAQVAKSIGAEEAELYLQKQVALVHALRKLLSEWRK